MTHTLFVLLAALALNAMAGDWQKHPANPAMEMWQFGPMGIFDMWESEKVTGTPQRSAYLRML